MVFKFKDAAKSCFHYVDVVALIGLQKLKNLPHLKTTLKL